MQLLRNSRIRFVGAVLIAVSICVLAGIAFKVHEQNIAERFRLSEWNAKELWYERSNMFKLFVKQYGLIGMRRAEVNAILGKGNGVTADSDQYVLEVNPLQNLWEGVDIHYDNDAATKYRFRRITTADAWITK